MKRLALLFFVAVLIPCGVLAWFAQRAMKDEQATFHRQHVLLAHEKSAALATRCRELLQEQLQAFEKATDEYLMAPADGEGEGLGAKPEASEVARWDRGLKQRYQLAERGYLEQIDVFKPAVAEVDKAEEVELLQVLAESTASDIPPPIADAAGKFADNRAVDRKELALEAKSLKMGIEPRAAGLGGAVSQVETLNAESLDSVENQPADRALADLAPEVLGVLPSANPPLAAAVASAPPAPDAAPAMKAKNISAQSINLGREPPREGADMTRPKEDFQALLMDADSPSQALESDQTFAKREQTPGLGEGEPRDGVKKGEDSFGLVASDEKLQAGAEPEMLRRANRRTLADDVTTDQAPAKDSRDEIAVTVRTVAPQHLSSEAQVKLARLSSEMVKLPSLDERMRLEKSGIAGKVTDDSGFQLVTWYRSPRQPGVVYGGEISVAKFLEALRTLAPEARASEENLCLAVLDHRGQPTFQTETGFSTDWSRPYVSMEIGPILPHWEAAVYLLRPDALQLGARAAQWRLGLILLAVLVAAIGGAALFWMETRRRWQEAQQKTDFVSQVSHELRTPLTAIQMFSDLLMKEAPTTDPAKSQRYAAVISQESQRLTRLINTVLDFSKLDRKGVVLDRTECDLKHIVQETLERYHPHLESLGFAVTAALPEEPVLLQADADRVAQILVNLLSNAEKYAADGKQIELTLTQDFVTSVAVIEISDRGPGIPAGHEKRIFQKFYRADDRLHSGIQGTGLGLTLARSLARAHGGNVTYARRAGGGSTFTLRLPT